MKKLMLYIVILVNSLIAIAGVCFWIHLSTLEDIYIKEIVVENGDVVKDRIYVRHLKLDPSEKQDYSAIINCHTSGNFEFVINFEKINDQGMPAFVNVVLFANEQKLYEGTLRDLLAQRSVYFEDRIQAGVPYEIKATYSIPSDAGNDANDTRIQFDMDINMYAT